MNLIKRNSIPTKRETREACRRRPGILSALIGLSLVSIALGSVSSLSGAVVTIKGKKDVLYAIIVSDRPDGLTVDVDDGRGGLTRQTIPKNQVEDVIPTISPDRLTALSPDRPTEYRVYAEELAEKRVDPEARQTAERLFLLAAKLDPAGEGRSAMLALATLVPPERAGAVRAVGFLIDPAHDRTILTPAGRTRETPATTAPPVDQDTLRLRALVLAGRLRRKEYATAAPMWNEPATQAKLVTAIPDFPVDAVEAVLADSGVLKSEVLLALVRAERVLRAGTTASAPASAAAGGDASSDPLPALVGGAEPVPVLSLEAVSPYDLGQTVYRDGAWRKP